MKKIACQISRAFDDAKNRTLAGYEYQQLLRKRGDGNILFSITRILLQANKRQAAHKYIIGMVAQNPDQAEWKHLRGYIDRKKAQQLSLYDLYQQQMAGNKDARWHFRFGLFFLGKKNWQLAETAFRRAIELKSAFQFHDKLARALNKQKKYWQEITELETAISIRLLPSKSLHLRLAQAQQKMGHFESAVKNYKASIGFFTKGWRSYYGLAYCLEQSGDRQAAGRYYRQAEKRGEKLNAETLGSGVFHQHDELYQDAIAAYMQKLETGGPNGELYYRLASMHSLICEWEEAKKYISAACDFDAAPANWFQLLAEACESLGQWNEAILNYQKTINASEKPRHFTLYRLGCVLDKAGRHSEACMIFSLIKYPPASALTKPGADSIAAYDIPMLEDLLSRDKTDALLHHELATLYMRSAMHEKAILSYEAAIARTDDHMPLWHQQLGLALMAQHRVEEACASFRQAEPLQGIDASLYAHYNKSGPVHKNARHTEYFEKLTLEENMVLYESFHGGSMSCNPYAIFLHLLDDGAFRNWTHIWVINDRSKIPDAYRSMDNVIFVTRESDLYSRYLARAKYLVNNNTFPMSFQKKTGQIYLNTWHGTPLKTLGKDIRGSFIEYKNAARNFLHASYLLSPNPHTSHILEDKHDLTGIYGGIIAETGYPRIDVTLNITEARKAALKQMMNIPAESKVVLYAPTWRGSLGDIRTDAGQFVTDIDALNKTGGHILFRGHAIDEAQIAKLSLATCLVPGTIDTNELLGIVDVLVTDYSSIAFDYMATGRPIVYYTHDEAQYAAERGMYMPMKDMPGDICPTLPEVVASVQKHLSGTPPHPLYAQARLDYCPHEDGQATKRVVDMVFFKKHDDIAVTNKPDVRHSILFYGGPFNMNGITTSYLNLLSAIDRDRFISTIGIDPGSISSQADNLAGFRRLPAHIRVIARVGGMNVTLEEKRIVDRFNKHYALETEQMWQIFNRCFQREFKRMFGDARFDRIVNFEGYNPKWAATLANPPDKKHKRKVIFQHNDMYGEMTQKYPSLRTNFHLYRQYDAVIAVSRQASNTNRDNIAARFQVSENLFDNIDNIQDERRTLDLARLPVEGRDLHIFEGSGPVFMTIGRLSSEKDHAKLLKSFKQVVAETPSARLIIVGDGPLRHDIAALIRKLELEKSAFLLGVRRNPFALLAKADCFVLSSHYEGQPMVLFEAMMLDKPIVSTDVVGSHDLLTGRSGLLVANTEDALAEGLRAFIRGEVTAVPFDCGRYNRNAIEQFYTKALGL